IGFVDQWASTLTAELASGVGNGYIDPADHAAISAAITAAAPGLIDLTLDDGAGSFEVVQLTAATSTDRIWITRA
ncbi:hypothetical protein QQ73_08160, partial [Candidatus Endoriftia persephone str. Guaymas]|nr:hypothetical protein [Candidatus Endoriftia persephone str. Guaymas]